MNFEFETYYDLFDLPVTCSQNDIISAYYRAKSTFANDSIATYSLYDETEVQLMRKKIDEAFLILGNREKRRLYDISLNHGIDQELFEQSAESEDHLVFAYTPQEEKKSDLLSSHDFIEDEYQPEKMELRVKVKAEEGGVDEIDPLKARIANSVSPLLSKKQNFIQDYIDSSSSKTKSNEQSRASSFDSGWQKDVYLAKGRQYFKENSFERNSEFEQKIKMETEFSGMFCRMVREYRNITIDEVCYRTKINRKYIAAIEMDAYDQLPAKVFLRGFLVQYFKILELPDQAINVYLKRTGKSG